MQGPHQVAQKSRTTTFPLRPARVSLPPETSGRSKPGAGRGLKEGAFAQAAARRTAARTRRRVTTFHYRGSDAAILGAAESRAFAASAGPSNPLSLRMIPEPRVWSTWTSPPTWCTKRPAVVEITLKRRAELVTFLARGVSVGIAAIALVVLWDAPTTKAIPALGVGIAYLVFSGASWLWVKRHPEWRHVARILHDVADALAVGLGAAWSGGSAARSGCSSIPT